MEAVHGEPHAGRHALVSGAIRRSAFMRRLIQRLLPAVAAAALLPLAGCGGGGDTGVGAGRLAAIKARGQLICGVDGKLPGFSYQDKGNYVGIDVDVCRALAAALFNDPTKVEFRELTSSERFTALASGEIDVLSRNTTYTLDRKSTRLNSSHSSVSRMPSSA